MFTLHTAQLEDIRDICAIQAACYDHRFLEHDRSFYSKIEQAAHTCWIAKINDQVIGYLISLPVTADTFPSLNASEFQYAAHPSLLYLHDLAVHPDYRATGAGKTLIT